MAIAIALIVIVAGSLLFHFASPWWLTTLASNWRQMDNTLAITIVITGIFFVVINFFIAYTVVRYRHKGGTRAAFVPDNAKLERWLIVGTSIGIMALLAPGLFVYAAYVDAPKDALAVEVLAQQWQWRFRFPGAGGTLGPSDARFVSDTNPFGLDPSSPAGQDNVLVNGNEVHLPIGRPVKMLLRSHDVLHDFFVPQFRARMNMVPGMVTTFWFKPTTAGQYEILCAQLCGVGHFNMRGRVVVEDESSFQAWMKQQPTFAKTAAAGATGSTPSSADPRVETGRRLAQSKGCVACHSVNGSPGVGPSWKGLAGKREIMADGSSVVADEAYLKQSVRAPNAQIVKGFAPVMPAFEMSEEELDALVAYIQSLDQPAPASPSASR